ncbi:MAG: DUF4389 domain-containing protein [Gammaproteobacteria bacterium]
MNINVKENVKNVDVWIRGLFIVIFGVIFYVLYIVIWLLVIFQFLTKVITGNLNQNLFNFSDGLTRYAFQILLYITFQSEERPFPFSPWPVGDKNKSATPEKPEAAAPAATKTTGDKPKKKS